MKTPEKWLEEIGYITASEELRQHRINQIREYQLDALESASAIMLEHDDSHGTAYNEIQRSIAELKSNRAAAMPNATELPVPEAVYPCYICREDFSWPPQDLRWSEKVKEWICEVCWEEESHGETGPALTEVLKAHNE